MPVMRNKKENNRFPNEPCMCPGTHLANLTTCSADTYTELSAWTPLVVSGERDASKGSLMLQGVLPAGRGYTSRVPSASPAGNINGNAELSDSFLEEHVYFLPLALEESGSAQASKDSVLLLQAATQVHLLVQPTAAVSGSWWTAKGGSFSEDDISSSKTIKGFLHYLWKRAQGSSQRNQKDMLDMTNLWNFMEEREHVDFPMFLELDVQLLRHQSHWMMEEAFTNDLLFHIIASGDATKLGWRWQQLVPIRSGCCLDGKLLALLSYCYLVDKLRCFTRDLINGLSVTSPSLLLSAISYTLMRLPAETKASGTVVADKSEQIPTDHWLQVAFARNWLDMEVVMAPVGWRLSPDGHLIKSSLAGSDQKLFILPSDRCKIGRYTSDVNSYPELCGMLLPCKAQRCMDIASDKPLERRALKIALSKWSKATGKETLGYTDPPAMNLNKVRDSITDYYTSIIIAVIDNVVAQLTGDVHGLKPWLSNPSETQVLWLQESLLCKLRGEAEETWVLLKLLNAEQSKGKLMCTFTDLLSSPRNEDPLGVSAPTE
ncbi:hypothetical protein Q9966_008017 [Columba livia]|nr:hypothetical protein Q9966_008017 [Columba livia]